MIANSGKEFSILSSVDNKMYDVSVSDPTKSLHIIASPAYWNLVAAMTGTMDKESIRNRLLSLMIDTKGTKIVGLGVYKERDHTVLNGIGTRLVKTPSGTVIDCLESMPFKTLYTDSQTTPEDPLVAREVKFSKRQ